MWTGTGRFLGAPAKTSPAQTPQFLHTVLRIRYARGPAPGNFFWGWAVFGTFDDRRGREATAGDLSARQVIESVPSRSAPAADIGRRTGCLKPGDGQKKSQPGTTNSAKKRQSAGLTVFFGRGKAFTTGKMQAIAAILCAKKGSYPVLLAFLVGGPHRAGR